MSRLDPRVAIAAGGALGALMRVAAAETAPVRAGEWPWATFTVNLAGSALLAAAVILLAGRSRMRVSLRAFIGAGFCGALTTFSTVQLETVELWRQGERALAVGYGAGTIAAALAVVALVSAATRRGAAT